MHTGNTANASELYSRVPQLIWRDYRKLFDTSLISIFIDHPIFEIYFLIYFISFILINLLL